MMICIGAACKDSSSMTNKICFMLYVRSHLSPNALFSLKTMNNLSIQFKFMHSLRNNLNIWLITSRPDLTAHQYFGYVSCILFHLLLSTVFLHKLQNKYQQSCAETVEVSKKEIM